MTIKRNWFIYLSLIIYLSSALLILNFGINQLGEAKQNPYLVPAELIAGFFIFYILLNGIFFLLTRPVLLKLFSHLPWIKYGLEVLTVLLLLAAGIAIRLWFIKTYPIDLESDYKFYYEVAVMIKNHTLNTLTDNEYITLFPNTYGYAYILAAAMKIFGTGKNTCLYLNIAFSSFTSIFCYGIGKKIAGSIAGLSALMLISFWPSQIIFSNVNGTEAAFNFFLYGAAFLAVNLIEWKIDTNTGLFLLIILHFLCGILIALSSAVRPMGVILLIACILVFLTINEKPKFRDVNELSIRTVFLSKGFIRVIFVLFGYFVCSKTITAGIAQTIEHNIADSGAMGYSLMVGMNIESDGGYTEDMMNYLYRTYDKNQSAEEANAACMKEAMEKMKADPLGITRLLAKKFFLVWSNDDYAATTNIITMKNQGLLSKSRERLFYLFADINNIYYFFTIFLSAVGVLFLMKRDNVASLFAVFFVGSVFLLIIVEMQNRYHYYALQSIAILAAGGIGFLYDWYKQHSLEQIQTKSMLVSGELSMTLDRENDEEAIRAEIEDNEEKKNNLQAIDVWKAIEEGHIIITSAKPYVDEIKQSASIDRSEEQESYSDHFYDCTEELWKEYNQEIREKQIQADNDRTEQMKECSDSVRSEEHQTADIKADHIVLKELLLGMEADLLRMKAMLSEESSQFVTEKTTENKRSVDRTQENETAEYKILVNKTPMNKIVKTKKAVTGNKIPVTRQRSSRETGQKKQTTKQKKADNTAAAAKTHANSIRSDFISKYRTLTDKNRKRNIHSKKAKV